MVNRHEACRMFGVSLATWANWQRAGKVRCAGWARTTPTHRTKLFALADLQLFLEQMRGADKVFRIGGGRYHIPDGMVGVEEACEMFGVDRGVLDRWEREGRITCGRFSDGGRKKIYPIAELNRLLAECGRHSPPYPDPGRPGCWRVPLAGHDIHRREAVIDDQDLSIVEGRSCHLSTYGEDNKGQVRISGKNAPLHHEIMGVDGKGWRVDHINGDTLDCRRANLVVQTRGERAAGMRKARAFCGKPCTSRFKGVCWDRRREKWIAYIKKDQVSRTLGSFDDEIEAAEARDKAARELFGVHAWLNFPEAGERGRVGGEVSLQQAA